MHGKSEIWKSWGPWPPRSQGSSPAQTTLKCTVQTANRGANPCKGSKRDSAGIRPAPLHHMHKPAALMRGDSSSTLLPRNGADRTSNHPPTNKT